MLDQTYFRYVAASAISLGVDVGIFLAALSAGVAPALAAACGYVVGIGSHWLLSSRMVFAGRVAAMSADRRQQQALFILSALVGLGITMAIVGLGAHYGFDPRVAKGVAIVVSFQTMYLLRNKVVFA